MPKITTDELLQLLQATSQGSKQAVNQLLPVVYDELRGLAASYFNHERSDHTLQPTALVHEVYMRLIGQRKINWKDRAQFFGAASIVMRRILVDHARKHKAAKRGGGEKKTAFDVALASFEERAVDLVSLDDALQRLAEIDERKCKIVELRFFGGFTVDETSTLMDLPKRTVEREWTMAKAWLRGEITKT